jgi:putative hydrolase of the HAD superfamily
LIRAALFDFGGVLLTSPFEAFAEYEQRRGLPEGVIRRINATDPDTNAWAQLERSEVTTEEFNALFAEEASVLGLDVPGFDLLEMLAGDLRPEMVEAVRRCSEHLVTGLLTNNFVTADGHPGMTEVLALFDQVVESSRIGVRKPDLRFYEIACELLEIEPSEAVFLDDLGINLKPARALGMTTIKVTDPAQALADLQTVVDFPLS